MYPHWRQTPETEPDWFEALANLARYLRTPEGCPWDREQGAQDFARFTHGEVEELIEALAGQDHQHAAEELGDALFCLLAVAAAAEEEQRFTLHDVLTRIHEKMIRRHEHVFGSNKAATPEEAIAAWERVKAAEKARKGQPGALRPRVAGIDGCPAGWAVCILASGGTIAIEVLPDFETVLSRLDKAAHIAVDMPIGLMPCDAKTQPRAADAAARALLKPAKSSSVFGSPSRDMLRAKAYEDVRPRGLSKQAWNLLPRIREIDARIAPRDQARIHESHPELIFRGIAGAPLETKKRTPEGFEERIALLEGKAGFPCRPAITQAMASIARRDAAPDDFVDACALAWAALQIDKGLAQTLPLEPPSDERGLRMEMWWRPLDGEPAP